jgi:4-amino-4-deoxy-L-arabinose transferase-like glycosyltransferase
MSNPVDDRFDFKIPLKWEYVLFIILFGLAICLRFLYLSADPPEGISISTGIETDPPQYTIFARNDILADSWNPYDDDRYVTYQYSLVSGVSRLVYGLGGTGTYQANLVGVLLSLLSILLFYFILRKIQGNGVALVALLFIGTNYLGIFYDRRPFLENGMILLFVLALFFLVFGERKAIGHFLFGFFMAASIFFGKIIGLAFLGVPIIYYIFKAATCRTSETFRPIAAMAAGFLVLAAGWYFMVYQPHAASITGYVNEQAFGLYGTPEAFASFFTFIWKFFSFGIKTHFFDRLPMISISALVFLIILGSHLFNRHESRSERTRYFGPVLMAAWLISIYAAEMPWNYMPLRYQTAMIFPLCGLAAMLTVYLFRLQGPINILNRSLVFNLVLFIAMALLGYHITHAVTAARGGNLKFNDGMPYILLYHSPEEKRT